MSIDQVISRITALDALGRGSAPRVPLGGWPAAKTADAASNVSAASSVAVGALDSPSQSAAGSFDASTGSLTGFSAWNPFDAAYLEARSALPSENGPVAAFVAGSQGPTVSSSLDWSGPPDQLPAATPFATEITEAATRNGLPARLLAAVCDVETRFHTDSVSPAGAQGLMQFMPATAAAMGVDPWNPASAIDGAARLLAGHLQRFGTIGAALAAYNTGSGTVARAGGAVPASATRYVEQVMTRYQPRAEAIATPRMGNWSTASRSSDVANLLKPGGPS
jgi:soluble lytic murein transglycosylase-like protein